MTQKWMFGGLVAVVVACLMVHMPARWLAAAVGFGAIADEGVVSGSIWKGQVSGLQGLAPVNFKTSLKDLLTAKPFVAFESNRPDFSISGHVGFGMAQDVRISAAVEALDSADRRLSNLAGRFNLALDSLRFGRSCQSAEGAVQTDVLQRNESRWRWRGPNLQGPITCEDGRLMIALEGGSLDQEVDVVIEIASDGRYTQRAQVITQDTFAQAALGLYGFEPDQGAYKLLQTGQWR